jgi:Fic family protein
MSLNKFFEAIDRLTLIDRFIRDPEFKATQPNIAAQLGVSDRTVRKDFGILRELGAPIVLIGRPANGDGFTYSEEWSLQDAIIQQIRSQPE